MLVTKFTAIWANFTPHPVRVGAGMCSVTRLELLRVVTVIGARCFSAAEVPNFDALGCGILRFLFDSGAKIICRRVIAQGVSSHFLKVSRL